MVNVGAGLGFQDGSCCRVFRDRIKVIWGSVGQSRASGINSEKLEARDVKGPDK